MSESSEFDSFVEILDDQLTSASAGGGHDGDAKVADGVIDVLRTMGILDLVADTSDLPDARAWLAAAVRITAKHSPSIGFALAAKFVAERAAGAEAQGCTAGVVMDDGSEPATWLATVPTALAPTGVVLLNRTACAGQLIAWQEVSAHAVDRSGLHSAALQVVEPLDAGAPLAAGADAALEEWDILHASVCLGVGERVLAEAERYARERRQFGHALVDFAGLRAILTRMRLGVATISATQGRALGPSGQTGGDRPRPGSGHPAEASALAGRLIVEIALDAIQVHGGYGYVDEYPVAGLLRDAVSLRARGGGRRSLTTALGAERFSAV